MARGQADLAKRLATDASSRTVSELTNDQIAQLGQRIATTDSRTDGLAVDARFDAALRAREPASGLRDAEWVQGLAAGAGFDLVADHAMPANNQLMVWRRG